MSHGNLVFGAFVALVLLGSIGFAYQAVVVTPERHRLIAERTDAEAALLAVSQAHDALRMRMAASDARAEALEATLRAFPPGRGRVMIRRRPGAATTGVLAIEQAYYRHLHAAGLVPKITHEAGRK